MTNRLKIAFRYFRYRLKAKHYKGHGIHSPFIYTFARQVLFNKEKNFDYSAIEKIRKLLQNNHQTIEIQHFGAAAKKNNTDLGKISAIVSVSATNKKYGRLLSRIVDFYKPNTVIELGTFLGIGTQYLAGFLNNNALLYTVEGAGGLVNVASQHLMQTNKNIRIINAKFEDALPQILTEIETVDLVFFDGNHTKNATIDYFEQCLSKINNESIFVFDDIHWSKGMEEAWQYIIDHTKTKVCIDLFQFGIVFFRNELTKQNFTIRF